MPFHTIAGIGSLTSLTLLGGATLVLPAAVDPATSLRMIRDEKISVLAQTPTFFIALANHPEFGPDTVGTVRRCLTYGGQVSPHAVDAWATATPESVWGTYWVSRNSPSWARSGGSSGSRTCPARTRRGSASRWAISRCASSTPTATMPRRANCSAAHRRSCWGTSRIRRRPRRSSKVVGSTPATSCASTTTATCSSATGART